MRIFLFPRRTTVFNYVLFAAIFFFTLGVFSATYNGGRNFSFVLRLGLFSPGTEIMRSASVLVSTTRSICYLENRRG